MITIVGAGPVGGYLGYLLAKKGFNVQILEKNAKIGIPVQCTGIVTSSISKIINLNDDFIVNKVKKARIFAPDGNFLELRMRPNLVLDRTKFDIHLVGMAKKAGAEVLLGSKFTSFVDGQIRYRSGGRIKSAKTDILVGADGPLSQVAKSAGLSGRREFFAGVQARAYMNNDNIVEFFPNIGDFAWIVPESRKVVRIGLLARNMPNEHFRRFLEQQLGREYKSCIINNQGGLVPIYNRDIATQGREVYLAGDAAAMVKATTGGGIIQGLMAAEALADSIANKKDYEKEWKKRIGADLYLALLVRKMLDSFSPKDYNLMVRLFQRAGLKKVLEDYDRDFLTRLLPRLLLEAVKEPRLLYFAKFLPSLLF
jgi:digeranylgeranylglycerophospholipid reductase